jgi:PAS domain S-box-containing protein
VAKRSNPDWKSIFLALPQATLVMDAAGTIVAGNRKMESLLKLRATDYRGRKCREVLHGKDEVVLAKDCLLARMGASGKTETNELFFEGVGNYCIASCSPMFGADGSLRFAIHSFTEIAERRQAELSLKRGEERLRNIINATDAGTWEWDIRTGEARIDERSAAILGYSLDELGPLTFESWMSLKHPEDSLESRDKIKAHLRGETEFYTHEARMLRKDGSWVWVQGRGKVVEWDGRGQPLRMFGTHLDITERRQAEERIGRLLEEKELILREVHHRIKNNMGTMHSFLRLQAGLVDDRVAVAALEDAAARVQSMLVLYDKLYQHSDFQTVSMPLYVTALVDEIAVNFPNAASVAIRKEIGDFSLDIKRAQALGIMINELITNAMIYAFPGRADGHIMVTAAQVGSLVRFSIEDDGVGMPDFLDFESSGGFGFTLIAGLARQLDGALRLERSQGPRIVLEFEK